MKKVNNMEFKGTKGKWSLIHSKSKTNWNVIGTRLGGRYKIAQLPYLSDPELSKEWNDKEKQEQLCNALLISKAPEMLNELIKEVEILKSMGLGDTDRCKRKEQLIKEATEI